jgi:hypothetical protein
LERREQTRFGVKSPVKFAWADGSGLRQEGQGRTRDINSRGMFIDSDSQPPEKADLEIEVSFRPFARTNLRMSVKGLVIRLESGSATKPEANQGFAVLNRSYKLHNGVPLES